MVLKDKMTQAMNKVDETTAIALDISREKVGGWLMTYTRLIGLALLIGIVVSISLKEYPLAILLFCTLHLQIIFRYSFRTSEGLDLWNNQPIEPQMNTGNGLKPPQV